MSQTDNEATATLSAGLLLTSTSSSPKYGRVWRRYFFATILISCKKPSNASPSPVTQEELPGEHVVDEERGLLRTTTTRSDSAQESYAPPLPPPPPEVAAEVQLVERSLSVAIDIDIPPEVERQHHGGRAEDQEEEDELQQLVARIVKEKDWSSLRKLGGVEGAASILGFNLGTGISEIQQTRRRTAMSPVHHDQSFLYFLFESFNRYTIFLLLISAGFSFPIDMMQDGPKHGWYEGVAILVAVLFLVSVPSLKNFLRSRKMQKKLREKTNKLEVAVLRGGHWRLVAVSDILVGDVLYLKKDDSVPAEGLLVDGENLMLDEELNSKVDRDRNPFLHSGSKVKNGHGRMLVTSVGRNTEFAKMQSLSTRDANDKKIFEARIQMPSIFIDNIALGVSVLIALVAFFRLLLSRKSSVDNGFPELRGDVTVKFLMKIFVKILLKPEGRISILTSCLAVLVIMFQHGMPFVITLSLSYWNDKVQLNEDVEFQNLSACVTMGLVTVICIDVSGGIMNEEIEVKNFWIGAKDVKNDMQSEIDPLVLEALQRAIYMSYLVPEIPVCPINDLLVSWANSRWDANMELLGQSLEIHDCGSSNNKVWGVLMKKGGDSEKIFYSHWKGPASIMLNKCSHYYDNGRICCLIDDQKETFEQKIKEMEDSGLRLIAFAYGEAEEAELKEDGLILLAVVGLKYQCLEETKLALEALRNEEVTIKLVSEDELSAVRPIAYELGFSNSEDLFIDGQEIQELAEMMQKIDVIGNILPEGKLRLVQGLQQEGQVVAFFGGSTTDTLVLKEADVGITKSTRSTGMARGSSDIVIPDDGFKSLISILKSGRCAYHNIQKFTQLHLTACISGSLITIVITMVLGESPITSIHLIWVNLIMCLLGGAMMLMELPSQKPFWDEPDKRSRSLVTKLMLRNIVTQVLYQAFVLLIFQFTGQALLGVKKKILNVMIFNSFALCQIFNQFNAMELAKKEVLEVVIRSYWFLLVLGEVMLVQFLFVEFAQVQDDGARLNVVQWVFCFLIAAFSWGFGLAVKFTSDSFSNPSFRASASHSSRFSATTNLRYRCYLGFPFCAFLFFSVSYYVNTGIDRILARIYQFERS